VRGSLRFADISAGSLYSCGVTTTGAGYCWGYNKLGGLGDGTTKSAFEPRAVAGHRRYRRIFASRTSAQPVTCGITTEGATLCWGAETEALGRQDGEQSEKPGPIIGALPMRAISPGFSHTCGLATSGAVYCWGDNRYGQLGDGAKETHFTPGLVALPP
jgi:alpha-tubulin suppressor-like RCC1 family protein